MVIPHDFTRDLKRGRGAEAQVIVDAADPLSSQSALQGASLAGLNVPARARTRARQPLELRVRPWYNPMLDSSTYIVPGIIGVLLSMTMIVINAMSVVRERERGTLEQLIVTPVDRTSLMLGKIVPFLLVGYVQVTVILLLGRLLFHVPIRGSIPLLLPHGLPFRGGEPRDRAVLLHPGADPGPGDAGRVHVHHAQHPALGIHVPPRRDAGTGPVDWPGAAADLLPDVLRGILLKGVGFEALWPEFLAMWGFAILIVTLSVRRFHKTLDNRER